MASTAAPARGSGARSSPGRIARTKTSSANGSKYFW